jgi:hypothetical protein
VTLYLRECLEKGLSLKFVLPEFSEALSACTKSRKRLLLHL